jgi:hypothetical protein
VQLALSEKFANDDPEGLLRIIALEPTPRNFEAYSGGER